jgi:hypothetical protein
MSLHRLFDSRDPAEPEQPGGNIHGSAQADHKYTRANVHRYAKQEQPRRAGFARPRVAWRFRAVYAVRITLLHRQWQKFRRKNIANTANFLIERKS